MARHKNQNSIGSTIPEGSICRQHVFIFAFMSASAGKDKSFFRYSEPLPCSYLLFVIDSGKRNIIFEVSGHRDFIRRSTYCPDTVCVLVTLHTEGIDIPEDSAEKAPEPEIAPERAV